MSRTPTQSTSPEMGEVVSLFEQHPHDEGVFDLHPSELPVSENVSSILTVRADLIENANPIPFDIAGGKVLVRGRICQWTGAFPRERAIEGIALIVPGFGGFKKTSRGFRNALAELGIPAVSYEPLRDSDASVWENLTDPQKLHIETVSAVLDDVRANEKVHAKIENGEDINYESALLLPHSMGGIAATPYAHDNPDRVNGIYFLATVGMGSPTIGQLARAFPEGFAGSLQHELMPYFRSGEIQLNPRNLLTAIRYFGKRCDRVVGEARSCLKTDVGDMVQDLTDHGKDTAYIAMKHDILVPEIRGVVGRVNKLIMVENMGHMGPQAKARKLAALILATRQAPTKAAA